jgi:hypothetical protein
LAAGADAVVPRISAVDEAAVAALYRRLARAGGN